MRYDYKVVPAPVKGTKSPGAKGAEGRFAAAVEQVMNDMATEGWEYQRAETLPSDERSGLTQTQTVWRNLLVFRRAADEDAGTVEPLRIAPPQDEKTPRKTPARSEPKQDAFAAQPAQEPETYEQVQQKPSQTAVETPNGASAAALPPALMARAKRVRARANEG